MIPQVDDVQLKSFADTVQFGVIAFALLLTLPVWIWFYLAGKLAKRYLK